MLGIFDSGIGGLTVVKELLRRHPDADFCYLGDNARAPYGNKSAETIAQYAVQDAKFLVSKGADVLVVACNSMSAGVEALRAAFPTLRIFEVATPSIQAAARTSRGCVGVIGTRATIASGVYERGLTALKPELRVCSAACPLFVPLVEEGMANARETKMIARRYLAPLRQAQVDTLILGCTHYPLLTDVIQEKVGRRVKIIDSPSALLDAMDATDVFASQTSPSVQRPLYFTDNGSRTREIAERWLGRAVTIERAVLE